MIDTVKIYTFISEKLYNTIKNKSIIKTSYSLDTGEIFYNIINDHLSGSYDTSLSVRPVLANKYNQCGFALEIEGSYHKIVKGYNSHEGYYNFYLVCQGLIKLVSNSYNVDLPNIKHWFVQRVDIAICFDLDNQNNVRRYLENLHACTFPRRQLNNYNSFGGGGIYVSGTTTTLKIYNKFLEFRKHDLKRFKNTSTFHIDNYLNIIQGFIRFEVEIKKRKLKDIYNKDFIRVINIDYTELKKVWSVEFMKLFKFYESELNIIRKKEDVKSRLFFLYGDRKGKVLYNFYCSLIVDGVSTVKNNISKSTFYRNIGILNKSGIDFSQKLTYNKDVFINFNPFNFEEVV